MVAMRLGRKALKVIPSLGRGGRLRKLALTATDSEFSDSIYSQRLNHLLGSVPGTTRYLEIGVEKGETFETITSDYRVGVDPRPLFDTAALPDGVEFFEDESDTFFSSWAGPKFDVVLVDGLHEAQQCYRDIVNAFSVLAPSGCVLVDDVWPSDPESSMASQEDSERLKSRVGITHRRWYGDVFKAIAAIHRRHPEIGVTVIGNPEFSHSQALLWRMKSKEIHKRESAVEFIKATDWNTIFQEPSEPWSNWITDQEFLSLPPD